MNSEILGEVLDHPIFDQYNEELNATQINMAYYDAMRRNARSMQTAAYAQARINECVEKLAAIDAQIEEAVYTLAEEYELNEAGKFGGLLTAAKGIGQRIGRGIAGAAERHTANLAGKAMPGPKLGPLRGFLAGAKDAAETNVKGAIDAGANRVARRAAQRGAAVGLVRGAAIGSAAAGAAGYAIGRSGSSTPAGGTPPAGGPPAGGPPAPAGPKPGTPVTTDPTEGPTRREKAKQAREGGYKYPSSNEKFSKAVTKAAYRNKLVGGGNSPDKIYPGQKLKIGGNEVTVQKGDTLSGLVQKSRVAKKAGQAGRTGTTADGSAGMSQQADF